MTYPCQGCGRILSSNRLISKRLHTLLLKKFPNGGEFLFRHGGICKTAPADMLPMLGSDESYVCMTLIKNLNNEMKRFEEGDGSDYGSDSWASPRKIQRREYRPRRKYGVVQPSLPLAGQAPARAPVPSPSAPELPYSFSSTGNRPSKKQSSVSLLEESRTHGAWHTKDNHTGTNVSVGAGTISVPLSMAFTGPPTLGAQQNEEPVTNSLVSRPLALVPETPAFQGALPRSEEIGLQRGLFNNENSNGISATLRRGLLEGPIFDSGQNEATRTRRPRVGRKKPRFNEFGKSWDRNNKREISIAEAADTTDMGKLRQELEATRMKLSEAIEEIGRLSGELGVLFANFSNCAMQMSFQRAKSEKSDTSDE